MAISLSAVAITRPVVNYICTTTALNQGKALSQSVQGIKTSAYSNGELTTALATYTTNRPEARAVVLGP